MTFGGDKNTNDGNLGIPDNRGPGGRKAFPEVEVVGNVARRPRRPGHQWLGVSFLAPRLRGGG